MVPGEYSTLVLSPSDSKYITWVSSYNFSSADTDTIVQLGCDMVKIYKAAVLA